MTAQPRNRLGQSPVEVSRLGVGCWSWGDSEYWQYGDQYGQTDAVDAFRSCLDSGLDFFDTAESYGWGKSEKLLGALVRRDRRPVVLATKYAPLAGRGGAAAIRKGLQGSIKRLGRRPIDLYQLHWPDKNEVPISATMDVLAEAVAAGDVRAVGVSNFGVAEMRDAHHALARHHVPLATNQVHYSLLHRSPEVDGVLETCAELGVTLLAYSPLEQGLLTGKYTVDSLPPEPRRVGAAFQAANVAAAQFVVQKLQAIAADRQCSPSAVALAWLLAKPSVIPLAGTRSQQQAFDNAAAVGLTLSSAQIADLDTLSQPWRRAGKSG